MYRYIISKKASLKKFLLNINMYLISMIYVLVYRYIKKVIKAIVQMFFKFMTACVFSHSELKNFQQTAISSINNLS